MATTKTTTKAKKKENKVSDVKQLISLGKEKGFLTYDEVNDVLPPDVTSPEAIDDIMVLFNNMDIEILDTESAEKRMAEKKEAGSDEDEAEVAEPKRISNFDDSTLGKTDDPMRMYLREMGQIPLLSREGEIVIAKRIEEGQLDVCMATVSTPVAINAVLELADQLRKDEISVSEMVVVSSDVNRGEEVDEEKERRAQEEDKKRVLSLVSKVKNQLRMMENKRNEGAKPE
ncbi:MAG: RNA polymerase sigma factor RpoD, partial [bacterium]|nr:RNA polymerase sigma factor RpoD [bacterium]